MTLGLTSRQRRGRLQVGWFYGLVGCGTFAAVLWYQWDRVLGLDWPTWGFFAFSFVVLQLRAVEVNDRLIFSSGVMPLFTGGVVFALQTGSAMSAMMLIGAAGLIGPGDLKKRRIFRPASNFGQLTVSAAVAGLVLDILLRDLSGRPVEQTSLFEIAVAGSIAALVYTVFNLGLVRVAVRVVYGTENLLPWSRMSSLFSAQVLMGFLGGMLGAILLASGPAVSDTPAGSPLIPLVLGVYVIGHLVYTSYSQLRQAHEDSLKGFVKTLETRDLYTRGHTERVAEFCQLIGEELRFTGTQLERLRWAALIHDVGKLAVPAELLGKQGALGDDEYRELRRHSHRVDDLLSEVDFLAPMVAVTSGYHPRLEQEDFGQRHHTHGMTPNLEQRVLAVADAFDAMTSSRSYRMSMSQSAAFEALRDNPSLLYDRDVVDALERALAASGRVFGQPTLGQWIKAGLPEVKSG